MSNNLKVYFASVDAILMVDDFEQHLPTPKTNMKPENASLEKENINPNHKFLGFRMLISSGVTNHFFFSGGSLPHVSSMMDGPGWLRPVSKATTLALQTAKIKV